MRVITGKAKGRRLQSVPGDSTRPITDRAKEALFSILGDWVVGTRVLDLFGGTGGVGIECLSRGADFVQFVDNSRSAVETINANLKHCRLERQANVERGDSFAFLRIHKGEPFDLIFVAPPQYQGLWKRAVLQIDAKPALLSEYGSVIVQVHPREEEPLALKYLQEYDRRRYGSVMLIFYASAAALAEEPDDDESDAFEDFALEDVELEVGEPEGDDAEDDELDDDELEDDELEDDELEDDELEDDELEDESEDDKLDREVLKKGYVEVEPAAEGVLEEELLRESDLRGVEFEIDEFNENTYDRFDREDEEPEFLEGGDDR